MTENPFLRALLLTVVIGIACSTSPLQAATPSVPVVYQDANVFIRAGILESGREAIHLGDAMTFVIDIEFDAGEIQIESPDDEWFQRVFAGVAGIRLYEPVAVASESTVGDKVHVMSTWRLQALDCPQDMLSCPGGKSYELPIMTVSYQLTDDSGSGVDSRSARFRPWPGAVVLAPSIAVAPEPDSKLTDILPGGAYAQPLDVSAASAASPWLLSAGAVLLLTSLFANFESRQPARAMRRTHDSDARWQRALDRLDDNALSDEEWSDQLRRSISWYCVDELDKNPYSWLGAAGTDALPTGRDLAAWREFFVDVLQQHGIDSGQRGQYLQRFRKLSGLSNGSELAATGR